MFDGPLERTVIKCQAKCTDQVRVCSRESVAGTIVGVSNYLRVVASVGDGTFLNVVTAAYNVDNEDSCQGTAQLSPIRVSEFWRAGDTIEAFDVPIVVS